MIRTKPLGMWLAVATLPLAVSAAGCGYDKSGNERELLGIFAAKYPEARWGVECTEKHAADSNPSCTVGFELRTPPNPTLRQAFTFANTVQAWALGIAARNRGAILPAQRDAQGALRAFDIKCPEQDEPTLSLAYALTGPALNAKLKLIKERRCRLDPTTTLSTVGK